MKIKINCEGSSLVYTYKNDKNMWCEMPYQSELSKEKFKNTNIEEVAEKVLGIIKNDYNIANRGVTVYFQGREEDFQFLKNMSYELYPESDIAIKFALNKSILVCGNIKSGKSTLIRAISVCLNERLDEEKEENYTLYSTSDKKIIIYDVNGIDIGEEKYNHFRNVANQLIDRNINSIIYCKNSTRLEEVELNFINYIKNYYKSIKLIIVLTQNINDDIDEFLNQCKNEFTDIDVLPVLAESKKLRNGVNIEAYGVPNLVEKLMYED
ncbi:MAG: GTPase [Lachnospirales bacterium]